MKATGIHWGRSSATGRPPKAPHHAHRPHHATFKFGHAHAAPKPTAAEKHEQLTEQTGKWVAQTFFGEMLKQARSDPLKSKLFDGGRGGEAFQEMADQRTAEGMASGAGHKLVDAIVRRIEAKSAYADQATAPTLAAPLDRGVA
jgi:Rod binding domain-containing protein